MKPLRWNKIDITTHLTPNMTSFHVEMNHFQSMYTVEPLEKVEEEETKYPYYSRINNIYDLLHGEEDIDEKFLMEESRVIPFVFSLREMRDLNRAISTNFNINYLRFFPYKGKYLVTNDGIPIEWKHMTEKTFNC